MNLNEINKSDFISRTVDDGYYPEDIPPTFRVQNLSKCALEHANQDKYLTKPQPTEHCLYNASKRGGNRRIFSMPNPVFMMDCAKYFLDFGEQISEHLDLSVSSHSVPKFNQEGRPLTISNHAEFHRDRRRSLALSRFIVKTDISKFFHSIYTHSLPWALHGKRSSKANRKIEDETHFGNRLDHIVRQSQDGQTIGIPVGPDFSRIISEIIAVAIDSEFQKRNSKNSPFLRLVDDIYIGADNQDEAQNLLSNIREAIRHFGLDINENKTQILPANLDIESYWPVEIRREIRRFCDGSRANASKKADFVHFLDEIIRISNRNMDDGIIKYAVRKIDDAHLWDDYWESLEPFLFRTIINFPHCWDYVAQVVAWRNRIFGLDGDTWKEAIEKSVKMNSQSGNDSEVAWALWLLKSVFEKGDSQGALGVIHGVSVSMMPGRRQCRNAAADPIRPT